MSDRPPESTHGILEPEHGRRHFSLTRRTPAGDLADHFERHWIVSWELDAAEELVQGTLPHPCVNLAAAMLTAPPGTRVAELADRPVSLRTLHRMFRDYVGVGPKWVLRRYRIHEAAGREPVAARR